MIVITFFKDVFEYKTSENNLSASLQVESKNDSDCMH